jgi:hypothetical protein
LLICCVTNSVLAVAETDCSIDDKDSEYFLRSVHGYRFATSQAALAFLLFTDNLDERIESEREREITRMMSEPAIKDQEEFHEDEEKKSTKTLQTLGDHFLQDDDDPIFVWLIDEITAIKRDDAERGLYETRTILITDYGTKASWPEAQISMCMTQFSRWLSLAATDPSLIHVINLRPSLLWRNFGTSSH